MTTSAARDSAKYCDSRTLNSLTGGTCREPRVVTIRHTETPAMSEDPRVPRALSKTTAHSVALARIPLASRRHVLLKMLPPRQLWQVQLWPGHTRFFLT